MTYKNATITAVVPVYEQWDFEEVDGSIQLTGFIDHGGADEGNGVELMVETDDDGAVDYFNSLRDAKAYVDALGSEL